jgi:hypothetical protein
MCEWVGMLEKNAGKMPALLTAVGCRYFAGAGMT